MQKTARTRLYVPDAGLPQLDLRDADTLGIRVLDHIILARDDVLSMVEEKIL